MKIYDLLYWVHLDKKKAKEELANGVIRFEPFGLKCFCGRQGSGKTIGMVEYADSLHQKYPKALICCNFDYKHATHRLKSLYDLYDIRNGTDGVIFMIDEFQNEFSSKVSKDFPEDMLSLVTQQRKQRIVILATTQVFTRLAKPLREQCFEVIQCRTFFGRWTRLRCYDAFDYNSCVDKTDMLKALHELRPKWRYSFVQSDDLRNEYDTYSVVERLSRHV